MEHSATYRLINILWSDLALFAASGILYLTNDWPSGSRTSHPGLDLKWPLVYAVTTVVFLFILFTTNREPPGRLQQWAIKYVNDRWITLFFHVAGLSFYGVTSVALIRRLAANGWETHEALLAVVIVGCAGMLIWSAFQPFSLKKSLFSVAVAGLALRLVAFWLNPIAVESAAMLPLIEAANKSFLAGLSPYRLYNLHSWPLPLSYLPGTWLAYLPAVATALDPRLVNAMAGLVVLGALALSHHNRVHNSLPLGTLIAMLIYLSPSVVIFDIYTEHLIFWMLIVLLFTLLAAGRVWAATLIWGIALATSPLTLVISPFVALHLARAISPKRWWKLGALTLAPFLALMVPFVVWALQDFFYGAFTWLNDLNIVARSAWVVHGHQQLFVISFAGWFWYAGWEQALKPIQAALVLTVLAYYWKRGRKADWLLPYSSLCAYTLFVCFNPILWPPLLRTCTVPGGSDSDSSVERSAGHGYETHTMLTRRRRNGRYRSNTHRRRLRGANG